MVFRITKVRFVCCAEAVRKEAFGQISWTLDNLVADDNLILVDGDEVACIRLV